MNLDNLSLEELQELETRRKRENPLAFYTPHDKQIEFHNQTNPIRIFLAGNRLGKTTGGAIEAIWYALGKHPTKKIPTPNEGWVVSVDFAASRDVAQKKILEYLPRKHLKKFHAVDQILELSNGSLISFKSGDSGGEQKLLGKKKKKKTSPRLKHVVEKSWFFFFFLGGGGREKKFVRKKKKKILKNLFVAPESPD